ncbi:MAG: cyclic nucleotide-binding domain-containing protein [Alphaproteobacteria bacterium]
MSERYQIAIIGSGPGGMSAAGRAAELGVSHILLERTDHLSDTIYKYQKGKHVMATPDILPLRSSMTFEAGAREAVLGAWDNECEKHGVNIRYNADLTGMKGEKGNFELTVNGSETIEADAVVLAIGLQGNLNPLRVPGAEWEGVQYQLDDPEEYEDETIVVIGAGDAAIENAVALSEQNQVIIVNRRNEFARAKDGNRKLIEDAIESEKLRCAYEANPVSVAPGEITLESKGGQERVSCNRVIARLGASPPRRFVESCGVEFPSEEMAALPELSPQYESNVSGLYIIGALGGYPLIKQAMNQGYEVVEFIQGNNIKPADEPLLEDKFGPLIDRFTVDEAIDWLRENIPLIRGLTALQLREVLLESDLHIKAAGDPIFEINEFGTTVFMIAEGLAHVQIDPTDPSVVVPLDTGKFFGEIAMVAARPRTATVVAAEPSVLLEIPRRTMIKLMNSVASVETQIRDAATARQLRVHLSQSISDELMGTILETAEEREFKWGQPLLQEGEESDGVFVIRKGSVTIYESAGGHEAFRAFAATGEFVGEGGVIENTKRGQTIRAATQVESIWIAGDRFKRIVDEVPDFKRRVHETMLTRVRHNQAASANEAWERSAEFLVDQGMGEATDILLIDETLCIGCDNCEKACAETHGGIARLKRETGPTFGNIHLPIACRHCEDPYCMSDCPADAIHRAQSGEVFIDEKCIGCGNCKINCPYDSIEMSGAPASKPGLLSWLLFGAGSGPGQNQAPAKPDNGGAAAPKLAVKCDSCKEIKGGHACVRACPTGAAFRVSPSEYFARIGS